MNKYYSCYCGKLNRIKHRNTKCDICWSKSIFGSQKDITESVIENMSMYDKLTYNLRILLMSHHIQVCEIVKKSNLQYK